MPHPPSRRRRSLLLAAILASAATLVPSVGAGACEAAGGEPMPRVDQPQGEVRFRGRAFGHGVGLSQYGAQGAAVSGCSTEVILSTYYPGTELTRPTLPANVRVGLTPDTKSAAYRSVLSLTNPTGSLTWQLVEDGRVTAEYLQGSGTWRVEVVGDGSFEIRQGSTLLVGGDSGRSGGRNGARLRVALGREVTVVELGRSYVGGTLEFGSAGASKLYLTHDVPLETYLRGIAEVPFSFRTAALRAQAIIARSYAAKKVLDIGTGYTSPTRTDGKHRCQCHVFASTSDQVYIGEGNIHRTEGGNWAAAVQSTGGVVVTHQGRVATTLYSSSHGGLSEDNRHVFGADLPYLRSVDDSNWTLEGKDPSAGWAVGFSLAAAADRLTKAGIGVGSLHDISVVETSPTGRATRVRLSGSSGTREVSGSALRSAMGLRSTFFSVEVTTPDPGTPITGDWDGDGRTDLGWYRAGTVVLRDAAGRTRSFRYGNPGDIPVTGDWNGDGTDTIGVVRDSVWYLRNSNTSGRADISFTYGRTSRGDHPIAGDWNGDGTDTVGIIRDGEWHLRNRHAGGRADIVFLYGRILRGDLPLVGDWNGDGIDTAGIVRDGEWHLIDTHRNGAADRSFVYGRILAGDTPVTGAWERGPDTPGIVRGSDWHLRLRNAGGSADRVIRFSGF